MIVEHSWCDGVEKTEVLGEERAPLPLCLPQVAYGLVWDQT